MGIRYRYVRYRLPFYRFYPFDSKKLRCTKGLLNCIQNRMSRLDRVRQWATFARTWHIFDAKWQNPFQSAKRITPILEGKNKPIYHPTVDSGDHVIVINSRHVCLIGTEWQQRVYFHHPGYNKSFPGGGAKWIPAWQLHSRDPTLVLWKACYNNMKGGLGRREFMARLHIYPEGLETVPEEILRNVSHTVEQPRAVPKKLDQYTQEEIKEFPKLWDYPEEYALK